MYKDVWTLVNKHKGAKKEDLAQWVSLAFKKAFMPQNICKFFKRIGIRSLNPNVMASKMNLSKSFKKCKNELT